MKPLFTEKQRFNQWWLWLLLVASSATPIIIMYKEYTNDTVSSNNMGINYNIFGYSTFCSITNEDSCYQRKHTINLLSVCLENH